MEKRLFIKFDNEGIVNMFSEKPRANHIIINDIPKDFKGSPRYYAIDFNNEGILGVKIREDLKEYLIKEAEEMRLLEEEIFGEIKE